MLSGTGMTTDTGLVSSCFTWINHHVKVLHCLCPCFQCWNTLQKAKKRRRLHLHLHNLLCSQMLNAHFQLWADPIKSLWQSKHIQASIELSLCSTTSICSLGPKHNLLLVVEYCKVTQDCISKYTPWTRICTCTQKKKYEAVVFLVKPHLFSASLASLMKQIRRPWLLTPRLCCTTENVLAQQTTRTWENYFWKVIKLHY